MPAPPAIPLARRGGALLLEVIVLLAALGAITLAALREQVEDDDILRLRQAGEQMAALGRAAASYVSANADNLNTRLTDAEVEMPPVLFLSGCQPAAVMTTTTTNDYDLGCLRPWLDIPPSPTLLGGSGGPGTQVPRLATFQAVRFVITRPCQAPGGADCGLVGVGDDRLREEVRPTGYVIAHALRAGTDSAGTPTARDSARMRQLLTFSGPGAARVVWNDTDVDGVEDLRTAEDAWYLAGAGWADRVIPAMINAFIPEDNPSTMVSRAGIMPAAAAVSTDFAVVSRDDVLLRRDGSNSPGTALEFAIPAAPRNPAGDSAVCTDVHWVLDPADDNLCVAPTFVAGNTPPCPRPWIAQGSTCRRPGIVGGNPDPAVTVLAGDDLAIQRVDLTGVTLDLDTVSVNRVSILETNNAINNALHVQRLSGTDPLAVLNVRNANLFLLDAGMLADGTPAHARDDGFTFSGNRVARRIDRANASFDSMGEIFTSANALGSAAERLLMADGELRVRRTSLSVPRDTRATAGSVHLTRDIERIPPITTATPTTTGTFDNTRPLHAATTVDSRGNRSPPEMILAMGFQRILDADPARRMPDTGEALVRARRLFSTNGNYNPVGDQISACLESATAAGYGIRAGRVTGPRFGAPPPARNENTGAELPGFNRLIPTPGSVDDRVGGAFSSSRRNYPFYRGGDYGNVQGEYDRVFTSRFNVEIAEENNGDRAVVLDNLPGTPATRGSTGVVFLEVTDDFCGNPGYNLRTSGLAQAGSVQAPWVRVQGSIVGIGGHRLALTRDRNRAARVRVTAHQRRSDGINPPLGANFREVRPTTPTQDGAWGADRIALYDDYIRMFPEFTTTDFTHAFCQITLESGVRNPAALNALNSRVMGGTCPAAHS